MRIIIPSRRCLKLLLCLVGLLFICATTNAQDNTISLSLNYANYDCTTGKIYLSYHVVNYDLFWETHYKTLIFLETGSDYLNSTSLDEGDIQFTGLYTPGDLIRLRAYGVSNNAAPETQFDYVVNGPTIPVAPNVIASPQTVLCNGGSTGLYASPSSGGVIYWSNGQTGNMISVSTPGTYYAWEINGCGQSPNSNMVTITAINNMVPPEISSSNGVFLCNGASTTLSVVSSPGGTVYWNNGQTGNSITVNTEGSYKVYIGNECGTSVYSNTIDINTGVVPTAPVITTGSSSQLCDGASAVLTVTAPAGSVLWNNGQTGNSITVSGTGSFYATQSNACGTSSNSNVLSFTTLSTPPAPSITPTGSQLLCDGASLNLIASSNVTWYRNVSVIQTGTSVSVSQAGNYTANTSNSCGTSGNSNTIIVSTGSRPITPTITPPGSQLLCNGQSAVLSSSGTNITWSNGATGNSMVTTTAGSYYAFDNNGCGNSLNSNIVSITTGVCPTPSPGTSFFICPGALKTLDAGAGYDSYSWSSGQTTRTISVGPGNYSVTVSKEGCFATSLAVSVNYYTVTAPTITPSGTTTFCSSNFVTLSSSPGSAYQWNTGATGNSINAATTGNYYVTVTDANGCAATSTPLAVTVNPLPTATVSGNAVVCKNGSTPSVVFFGSGGSAPYTFYYKINGGTLLSVVTSSGNSASVSVPTNTAGNFVYELVSVKESSSTACTNAASGTATVVVNELPSASITGTTTVCLQSASPAITFTGSGGVAPYTFTYNINGGSNQTVSTVSGNSVAISVPTNNAGTFTYNLINVRETGTLICLNSSIGSATIVVKALPVASIAGTVSVCQNATRPLITFTGSTGTTPYIFTYQVNGGVNQTVTSSGNSVSIEAPTNTIGTFTYSLVSVQESSGQTCVNAASGTATLVVNPLPSATITGNATVCQNSGARTITFTGSNATAPYTFTYQINGGSLQTISTVTGNSVSISVPTSTSGTFVYSLISVKETTSITACSNPVSVNATIVVNPLPTTAILSAPNTHLCNGETGQITISNWLEGVNYTWFKDGVLLTVSPSQILEVTQPGTYTVMATSAEGCNAPGLSNPIQITTGAISKPIITGYLKVCEGGRTKLSVLPTNANLAYELYRWTQVFREPPNIDTGLNGKNFSAFAGQYKLQVERQGCVDSAFVAITANDTEFPAGMLTVDPISIPYGGQASLSANVVGAENYYWELGDGNRLNSLSPNILHNYFLAGDSILVKVKAMSERNCITELSAYVSVAPDRKVTIENRSFTGNLKDWNVFPIPFRNELKVSAILGRNETVRIDLFTADGSWVNSWHFPGRKGENLFKLDKLESLANNVIYIITGFYNAKKHSERIFKY